MTLRTSSPRARSRWAFLVSAVVMMLLLLATAVLASHPEASLTGSNFELDVDANLKVDDPSPSVDWANLAHTGTNPPEKRATDEPTGQSDDSYKGGVKEDTPCPGETTGSIPNNKSDLLTFHVYQEPGQGSHPGFLHLGWSRVTDPSGTTLMDFEFNQSSTSCSDGPNKVRTAGDLLIEYAIDQGGSRADLTVREWSGTAWGAASDLDVPSATCGGNPCAAGTINQSPIPAAESDGLISSGQKAARTFGEASIDLRLLFDPNECSTFGSAMIKSRSSDSFTSQLKDFIRPLSINLTNCGSVIIRKVTNPNTEPATTLFGYTKSFTTDPTSANTFSLGNGQSKTFNNVLQGTGYTVDETTVATGWQFVSVNCSASTGVTPTIVGSLVTFAIDSPTDVLDCTYTNRAQFKVLVFVCNQASNTLHSSTVVFQDSSKSSLATGTLPSGITEATLCGLTTGAQYPGFSPGSYGDDDNAVTIP